jgi:lauroyl/myristoyl acyltransferase
MFELMRPKTAAEALDLTHNVLFSDFKNRCLMYAWSSGLGFAKNMIRCPDAEKLQEMHRNKQPAIFVFSHFGPRYSIAPAFQSVGVPVAMFQGNLPVGLTKESVESFAGELEGMEYYWVNKENGNRELEGMEYYWVNKENGNRAANLKRAVDRLKAGGLVTMAIDGGHGDVLVDAEFLGYRISVARGPVILARLAGVPLIPVTITWDKGWSMEFRIHDPIPGADQLQLAPEEDADTARTRHTMKFFDEFIRRHPEQLRLDKLARLITLPKSNSNAPERVAMA